MRNGIRKKHFTLLMNGSKNESKHYFKYFASHFNSFPPPSIHVSYFTDSLPKVNPLLSLPKTSIPRMFWNQLSKYSSPILLTSLIHSLSLCYTPRGDYRELASYLLTQCACLHQWELIEQVLSWMKKNVPNSGLVFSNLLDL